MFLVDAGPGTPRICIQDEPIGVPINRATRFENKVGSLDVVAGEPLIKEHILERFFINLVAGESLIKERAAARGWKLLSYIRFPLVARCQFCLRARMTWWFLTATAEVNCTGTKASRPESMIESIYKDDFLKKFLDSSKCDYGLRMGPDRRSRGQQEENGYGTPSFKEVVPRKGQDSAQLRFLVCRGWSFMLNGIRGDNKMTKVFLIQVRFLKCPLGGLVIRMLGDSQLSIGSRLSSKVTSF
ncbi:hypothetical protein NE237_032416 [Protea cynaroides]|uniref:Ribosomal protein S1 n=1 Tax=Protea cynaroides TaxID=273540 RepID=A0A9Q0L480_9MAGN|nr:hypothetical protein NE237_032416 [Protea cynaroides]